MGHCAAPRVELVRAVEFDKCDGATLFNDEVFVLRCHRKPPDVAWGRVHMGTGAKSYTGAGGFVGEAAGEGARRM